MVLTWELMLIFDIPDYEEIWRVFASRDFVRFYSCFTSVWKGRISGWFHKLNMTLVCVQSQALIEELLLYKRSEDQIELKEKQLSTMRVDVCSTETLKCLKGNTYIPLNRISRIFFLDMSSSSDQTDFLHKDLTL